MEIKEQDNAVSDLKRVGFVPIGSVPVVALPVDLVQEFGREAVQRCIDAGYLPTQIGNLLGRMRGRASKPVKQKRNDVKDVNKFISDPEYYTLLLKALNARGLMVVPHDPTPTMVIASMQTVTNVLAPMSKREKHRLRLSAALTAHRLETQAKSKPRDSK